MSLFQKIINLLDITEKRKLFILLLVILFTMILEVVGIALIVPLINVILNKDLVIDWLNNNNLSYFSDNYQYDELIYILIAVTFLIYLFKNIISIYFIWVQNKFTNDVQVRIANSLLKKYLLLSYENFIEKNTSILLRNIEEVRTFQGVLLRGTLAVSEFIIFFGIITLLFYYNFEITFFIGFVFILISFSIFKFFTPLVKKLGEARLFHATKTTFHLFQALNAFKEIKIFGRLSHFFDKFYLHNSQTMKSNLKYNLYDNFPKVLLEMLFISTLLLAVAVMIFLKFEFDKIITLLGLYSVAAFRIMPSINRIIQSLQNLKFMMPVVDMLTRDLEIEISTKKFLNKTDSNKNLSFNNSIVFKNVDFKYKNRSQNTLKEINFEINKNQIVGIIGESGSGKSTLINLILGLLKPNKGSIKVDDSDINDNIEDWRKFIGYVPQNIFIIDDTLKNNIALGINENEISSTKIDESINLSQLRKYVEKQEKGLDTLIGEKGSKISGGELQRLGIARALYNKPKILILDESTNSLDLDTENLLLKEIEQLKNKITIIIITHRESTLRICEKIIKIKNGRVDR